MSQFYDQASLVMVPSGYKAGKVYSQKPLSTDGELTFTRASNATRVNADGLVEKVRTNLLLQSNQFDTTWTNTNSTETGGQSGYDGSNNAWLLETTGANGRLVQSIAQSGVQTFSVYAKAGTYNFVRPLAFDGSTNPDVFFDLSTGTISSIDPACIDAQMEDVGGGWYRCSITYNTTISEVRIYPAFADGDTATNPGNILIQNAQLEYGDIATDYIPTTSAAVSVGPVSGLPRLDYSGGCPSLLLEPQRTNASIWSEQMSNAPWSFSGGLTVSANQTTSPAGYVDADKVIIGSNQYGELRNPASSQTAGTYTVSVFVKKGDLSWCILQTDNGVDYARGWFDIENGTVGSNSVVGWTFNSSKIENYSNGWYRISITATTTATTNNKLVLFGSTGNGAFGASINSYFFAWGAQLEAGSYATSYIPTLGSAVTRLADSLRTASGATSLFNSTWTAFGELNIPAQGNALVATGYGLRSTYGGTSQSNWTLNVLHGSTSNTLKIAWYAAGSQIKDVNVTITYGTPFKFAATSDGILYVNGAQISASSSLTPGTPVELTFGRLAQTDGSMGEAESVAQTLLFKSILTSAQLAELTAL